MVILDPRRRKHGSPSDASGVEVEAGLVGDDYLTRSSKLTVIVVTLSSVIV